MSNHYTREQLCSYRNKKMSPSDQQLCQAHLRECPECAKIMEMLYKEDEFYTRISLLGRVKAGDEASWTDFYNKYKELIRRFGNRRGLKKEEIDDLIQNVMLELSHKGLENYDPELLPNVGENYEKTRGRFRYYLLGITYNQAMKIFAERKGHISIDAPEYQVFEPAIDDWEKIWDEEWKHFAVNVALEMLKKRVEPKTYQAFHMNAIQGRPVQDVATFLGMSKESVYQHKHRCLDILKESISNLEEL